MNPKDGELPSKVQKFEVAIIGTRGIPNQYGGFEAFIEKLTDEAIWPDSSYFFKILGETSYFAGHNRENIPIGLSKDKAPIRYYLRSYLRARASADLIVCCGVGISIFAGLSTMGGPPIILNPDGCEWRRSKWSPLGRLSIKLMTYIAIFFAKVIVLDSEALRSDFFKRKKRSNKKKISVIAYPVEKRREKLKLPVTRFGVDGSYVLAIARLEPENGIRELIEAYLSSRIRQTKKLVIVGGKTTQHYLESLASFQSAEVIFLGGIYDSTAVNGLRDNCDLYIHGHSVGGTNPSLLEAMSSFAPQIIARDTKYNREVGGELLAYFSSPQQLSALLDSIVEPENSGLPPAEERRTVISADRRYNLNTIKTAYASLFSELLDADSSP